MTDKPQVLECIDILIKEHGKWNQDGAIPIYNQNADFTCPNCNTTFPVESVVLFYWGHILNKDGKLVEHFTRPQEPFICPGCGKKYDELFCDCSLTYEEQKG